MRARRPWLILCAAAAAVGVGGAAAGCGGSSGTVDGGGGVLDAGAVDAAQPDAGVVVDAAAPVDARAPVPATVVTTTAGAFSLWADDEAVYWATTSTIVRWDASAGTQLALATGEAAPLGLTGDGDWLYWSVGDLAGPGTSAIRRCPDDAAGGAMTFIGSQTAPYFLDNDGVELFWTDYTGIVLAAPLDDGVPARILAAGLSNTTGIAATTDNVYFEDIGATPRRIDRVAKSPPASAIVPIAQSGNLNGVIAADGNVVFWIDDRTVVRFAEDGGGFAEPVITEPAILRGLTIAGGYAYWVVGGSSGNALLRRMPVAGGEADAETIAGEFDATAYLEIGVGGAMVYWFSGPDILSAPR